MSFVIVYLYMINLNLLYSFFTCAEHLNFSKAASLLGISQPSLSMQIKNLEEQVGAPLFLRNGRSISLTTKGKELLELSSSFYDLKSEIRKRVEGKKDSETPNALRILVTREVERPFVAEVVSRLKRKDSKRMEIRAIIGSAEGEDQEGDIILTHEKPGPSWNFVKIDFPVFFATSSPLPESPQFNDPSNIQKVLEYFNEDMIIPSKDTKLGQEFSAFRKKTGFRKEVILESNIVSCLVRFVASGAGCGFLPLPYIKSSLYHNHIRLIGPRQGYWKHSIYIGARIPQRELELHPLVKHIRNFSV